MGEQYRQQSFHGARSQPRERENTPMPDFRKIKFTPEKDKNLDPELFNSVAKEMARAVAHADRNANKSTQLRRFYDELVLWETRVSQQPLEQQPAKFEECLLFIRMINAKAAYAEGRRLVDRTFVDLMHHTLAEVKGADSLSTCKLFWEAFMGFYKQERGDN